MNSVAGAQARAKEFAHQIHESAEDVRDNIQDMGNSVSDTATRQYERAQDTVMDALRETGSDAKRNSCLPSVCPGRRLSIRACTAGHASRVLSGVGFRTSP
jgi:hypothetical protein